MQQHPKKLLDQVRDAIRLKHYAHHTEETYLQWIRETHETRKLLAEVIAE